MENLNRILSCPLLAEGTNANTFKTTYAMSYAIKGLAYYKAATDNIAFTAGHAQIPAGYEAIIAVDIDSGGTVSTVQSNLVKTTDLANGVDQFEWPALSRDKCRIGGIRVKCQNSATFTAGSTDLSATDVIDTYIHLADYPANGEAMTLV
jgi:hypothetical protein